MLILAYLVIVLLIVGLVFFMYLYRGKPLSDKTNIVATIVNLCMLVLALISIHVALNSYRTAQESGKQQQITLDASKNSLESVVSSLNEQQKALDSSRQSLENSLDTAIQQQTLLQQNVRIARNQLMVLEAYQKRLSEHSDLLHRQLELNRSLAHMGIEPYIDCDLIYPERGEKRDPYIVIINTSPIKLSMLKVDGYAMPFDSEGKGGLSMQRRMYPGHLFFRAELKPYEFINVTVMKVPPPNRRNKDIVKVFYIFDLKYRRSTDLAEFKNRVAFELIETGNTSVKKVRDLQNHPYYSEIESWIRCQEEVMPKDKPESYLRY